MLQLKNICKSYKTGDFVQKALDNVSVNFRDSEFVAVLGPSGSGKTTMLNVIGGLARYDSGELVINGVSTSKYKETDWDAYRNHEIGFVFQSYNLIPHQTILNNVELALTLTGISPKERKRRAKQALTEVGLKDHIKKFPNQLSGGQMQRVAIARALVNNPSIIFADEPTGALDTKTSVAVMDVLKTVAKDRLVVMVTHNPELAEEYATRIVKLEDGHITSDNKPYNPRESTIKKAEEAATEKHKKQRTSMSFLTALLLSFANLMGKKGRTFMTAFAGSIGIIGIAGILALSTGTSLYIDNVEHNTLSQYPLYISRSKSMLGDISESAQSGSISQQIKDLEYNQNEEGTISVRSVLSVMLGTSGKNDLKSLKAYLDDNPDDYNSYVTSTQYSFNATPLIYSQNQYGTKEVHPKNILGTNSSSSSSGMSLSSSSSSSSTSSMMADFSVLPIEEEIYNKKYTITAGHWPENAYECVLVLHQDGSLSDSMLYTLGLRDYKEALNAMKAYSRNESTNLPEEYDAIPYDKILGTTFKVVNPAAAFVYNETTGVYEDMSEDEAFMNDLVSKSADLKIVGIVNPPEGLNNAYSLSSGINYTDELNQICIENSKQYDVVKAQLERPDYDVLAGKTFAEEKAAAMEAASSLSQDYVAPENIIEINPDAITNAFSFDASKLSVPKVEIDQTKIAEIVAEAFSAEKIAALVADLSSCEDLNDAMKEVVAKSAAEFLEAKKVDPSLEAKVYFSEGGAGYKRIEEACAAAGVAVTPTVLTHMAQTCEEVTTKVFEAVVPQITNAMSSLAEVLFAENGAFSFNSAALDDLIKVNLSADKIKQLSTLMNGSASRTYESNLTTFGYADTTNPVSITIYPNDFYAKESVTKIIDGYNEKQAEANQPTISYTDYAKVLMQSVNTMIDMITAVLIAFVAISLVVSSIMIGIITYISVLERRREIGILRAIGARKRDIFRVFNAETFIVGLVAGIIGILITVIGCIPANIIARGVFNVEYDIAILPFWAGIALIAISVGLTLIAGLIPSSSASRKDPVEAINS